MAAGRAAAAPTGTRRTASRWSRRGGRGPRRRVRSWPAEPAAIAADLNARGVDGPQPAGRGGPTELRRGPAAPPQRRADAAPRPGRRGGRLAALVDHDTWRAVVAVLTDPMRRTNTSSGPRWLLSGIALLRRLRRPGASRIGAGGRADLHLPLRQARGSLDAARSTRYVDAVILERLSRPDARELLTPDKAVDTAALHTCGMRRCGSGSTGWPPRTRTGRSTAASSGGYRRASGPSGPRSTAKLAASARGSVLAGVADAPDPAEVWESLDLDRRRAVVQVLVDVIILPARKGRRPGWQPGESLLRPAARCASLRSGHEPDRPRTMAICLRATTVWPGASSRQPAARQQAEWGRPRCPGAPPASRRDRSWQEPGYCGATSITGTRLGPRDWLDEILRPGRDGRSVRDP